MFLSAESFLLLVACRLPLGFCFPFKLTELNFGAENGKIFKNNWLAYLEK